MFVLLGEFNLTLAIFSLAEYLKIADIRKFLTPRDSPFVAGNNAGGGFGKTLFNSFPSFPWPLSLPLVSNSSLTLNPFFCSWRH